MKSLKKVIAVAMIILIAVSAIFTAVFLLSDHGTNKFRNFITRNSDKLMDGDKEFRFISCTIPPIHVVENGGWRLIDPYEQEDAFKSLSQMGAKAVRIYVFSVKKQDDPPETPRHVMAPGEFNEDIWRSFDYTLKLANEYGIRLIVPFVDQWDYWGGVPQYAAFRGKKEADFWTDPQIREDFKKTINYALNRTNYYTGIKYKDDKAILAWQLGNELKSTDEWISEMAAYVKSIDSKHLVADGGYVREQDIRPNALNDANIDIIDAHYYGYHNYDMVAKLQKHRDICKGKKALIIGEFGMDSTDTLNALMDAVIGNGTSGACLWGMRYHKREGGFYWHEETTFDDITYWSYHWPGFAWGDSYDETNILESAREHAYRIAGMDVPARSIPDAPVLRPIKSTAGISWRGSAGAEKYDIERAENSGGPWKVVGKDVLDSTNPYMPFNDYSAVQGKQYYYRVIAKNIAGMSKPSNVVAAVGRSPIKPFPMPVPPPKPSPRPKSGQINDELNDFGKVFSHSDKLAFVTQNPDQFMGDASRLTSSGEANENIIYKTAGVMKSFEAIAYFPTVEKTGAFKFYSSPDGMAYTELKPDTKNIAGDVKSVKYSSRVLPADTKYIKIEFGGASKDSQLGRVVIECAGGMVDDFEGYDGNDLNLQTAYSRNTGGNEITVTLDAANKNEGSYGMKYTYKIDDPDYCGVVKNLNKADWSGCKGIRFWIKPDGSDRTLTVQFKETNGEYWETYYKLSDKEPKVIDLPFTSFKRPPWYKGDGNGAVDLGSIKELSLYVNKGDGKPGESILYFDSIIPYR